MRTALLTVSSLLALACGSPKPPPPPPTPWTPGTSYQTPRAPGARGLLDRKGLIHAHSPYSHDACDGEPVLADGGTDLGCLDDFRRGLCQAKHDFVFLTDHGTRFYETEYPDALLYDASRGDALLSRGGLDTASWLACPDAAPSLVMAGTEGDWMPVGLEGHVAATRAERSAICGTPSVANAAALKAKGAVVLAQHTEDWTPQQLIDLPFDGFEMFNLHNNALVNGGAILELVLELDKQAPGFPHSDIAFLALKDVETPRYLATWGTVLASGARRVTTMGTDCHRNSFPQIMPDGERIDSYRRMMQMFSNHLLVRPAADGSFDDAALKEALRAGRLYGAFEVLGTPEGFDFHALEAGVVKEMGEAVSLGKGVTLSVTLPSVQNLDPAAEAPWRRIRILKAKDGGWTEMASAKSSTTFTVTEAGAYRAEVRLVPRHVEGFAGTRKDLALGERPWVYSNAIYVEP